MEIILNSPGPNKSDTQSKKLNMKVIEEFLTTLPLGIQALDLIFPSKAVPNDLKFVAKTFVEKLISERSEKDLFVSSRMSILIFSVI